MSPLGGTDTEPRGIKRPRPVISCLVCRRKKLKCDRLYPCQQCVKIGQAASCIYQPGQNPEPRDDAHEKRRRSSIVQPASQSPNPAGFGDSALPLPTATGNDGGQALEQLHQRVALLEQMMRTGGLPDGTVPPTPLSPQDHINQGPGSHVDLVEQATPRYAFPYAAAFIRDLRTDAAQDAAILPLSRDLRCLQSTIMLRQPTKVREKRRLELDEVRAVLPPASVCENLIELYFDNLEHCFRILHRPTFDIQAKVFFSTNTVEDSRGFLPQLLGVLSIASLLAINRECVEVDRNLVSKAMQYMQEYLEDLEPRYRYQIPALQVKMLMMLLGWIRQDRMSDLYNLSGQILRQALIMGLDKDPNELAEPVSILEAEIRRRMWMTIVEEDMMLSILCGMPCTVPQFTCKSPINVNDDELREDLRVMPQSRPFNEWSDGLCQYVLAQSIRQRLHACQDLDRTKSGHYNRVLEYTRFFEKILQQLPAPLRYNHRDDEASKAPARLMARMELDISIRRPLMYLYNPFAYGNDINDIYKEARAGFLQSCLMVTTYQDLFDPKFSEVDVERPEGYWDFFYNVYRQEINQAALGICHEVKLLFMAPESMATTPAAGVPIPKTPQCTRNSMVNTIKDSLEPMVRRVSHSGESLKDVTYLSIVLASVQSQYENKTAIIEALQELIRACEAQLKEEGISIHATVGVGTPGIAARASSLADFDPSWMDFPTAGSDFGLD